MPFSRVCSTFLCVSFATSIPLGHKAVSLPMFFTNLTKQEFREPEGQLFCLRGHCWLVRHARSGCHVRVPPRHRAVFDVACSATVKHSTNQPTPRKGLSIKLSKDSAQLGLFFLADLLILPCWQDITVGVLALYARAWIEMPMPTLTLRCKLR